MVKFFALFTLLASLLRLLILTLSLFSAAAGSALPAREGFTLQSTRVIYPQTKKKGITFTLKNDTEGPYLIQTRVDKSSPDTLHTESTLAQQDTSPFVVLPPLRRLNAGEQLTLTIRRTENILPTDRESVFFLQIKAIPGTSDRQSTAAAAGQIKVMLALQNTMKLFYRPETLPAWTIDQIGEKLRFAQQGDRLTVTNDSPYYVTFHDLSVGGKAIAAASLFKMVSPFGQQTYSLPASASGEVSWQLINDYGRASKVFRRSTTP